MPTYQVLKPGFRHSRFYDPRGKRPTIIETLPFTAKSEKNPKPSWIGDVVKAPKKKPAPEQTFDESEQASDIPDLPNKTTAEKAPDFNKSEDISNSEDAEPSKAGNSNTETL